jgi:hypothetical protein
VAVSSGDGGIPVIVVAGLAKSKNGGSDMNTVLPQALAVSLTMTLILESLFFVLLCKCSKLCKPNKKDWLLLVLVNIMTNPPVVLTFWLVVLFTDWNARILQIPLELLAVLVEGYFYKKYGQDFKRPYLFALAANAFSFAVGVLLQWSLPV